VTVCGGRVTTWPCTKAGVEGSKDSVVRSVKQRLYCLQIGMPFLGVQICPSLGSSSPCRNRCCALAVTKLVGTQVAAMGYHTSVPSSESVPYVLKRDFRNLSCSISSLDVFMVTVALVGSRYRVIIKSRKLQSFEFFYMTSVSMSAII